MCLLQVRLRILYRVSIPGIVRTICSFPPILSQLLVPTAGFEPARLSTLHSECSTSACSVTRAYKKRVATNPHLPATAHAPVYWWPPHWFCSSPLHILYFSDSSYGGDSGTWTHTVSLPSDFESDASANSTISPYKTHLRVCSPVSSITGGFYG